jgi:hypothetical protein
MRRNRSTTRPRFARAVAAAAGAAALIVGSATPAAAVGGETFGCRIAPGTTFTFTPVCYNDPVPATTYTVGFAVQNRSGSGYTYSWSISGPYQSVYVGCTPTSSDCAVTVRRSSGEEEIVATVTYTQAGQSASRTSYAYIEPVCGTSFC